MNERVKHRGTPAEPFAQPGAYGLITRTHPDGPLRITPAYRNIPAMAFVSWQDGEYATWERLADLIPASKPRKDKAARE